MKEAKEREGERKGMERKGTNEKRGVAARGDIALPRQREDTGCCTGPVETSLLKGNKVQKEGRKMALGRGYVPSQHTPHGWEHRGSMGLSPAHRAILCPGLRASFSGVPPKMQSPDSGRSPRGAGMEMRMGRVGESHYRALSSALLPALPAPSATGFVLLSTTGEQDQRLRPGGGVPPGEEWLIFS